MRRYIRYQRNSAGPRNRRPLLVVLGLVTAGALAAGTGMSFAAQNNVAQRNAGRNNQGQNRGAAPATPNPDCTIVVPPNPLSAAGLATPYQLSATNPANGQCHEADAATAAFVQATVVSPAGKVAVYNPLVIDAGARAAVQPVVPQIAPGSTVGIWFGFNGTNLTLKDKNGSLGAGRCVTGLGNSIFGQFADCNGSAFFAAANGAVRALKLAVPALGTGTDGKPCPTTRDFTMIDQDQSDNVTSAYLIKGGAAAQDTAANRAKLPGATVQVNGSDNLLLTNFIDKAVGCTPFTAPDLADNNTPTTSLALNELQAAADQKGTVALVPPNDPMVEVNGNFQTAKLNLYRAAVDQPAIGNQNNTALAASYCQNMVNLQPARLQLDQRLTQAVTTPDPAAANNLFTFLAQRLNASFTNLNCQNFIKTGNPVTVQTRNGVAVSATFAKAGGNNAAGGKNNKPSAGATTPPAGATTPPAPAPATSQPTTVRRHKHW